MSDKISLPKRVKIAKRNGNEARNATYQLRSDLNELIDLNAVISSVTFLGTRQLLNQQRNDLMEHIFQELEDQSDLSNMIDIEDIKLTLEVLSIEHRSYLNSQLKKINDKVVEAERLQDEINTIRDKANQSSSEFNAKLQKFRENLKVQNLSIEALEASGTAEIDEFEERLDKANEENAFVIEQTNLLSKTLPDKTSYLESKIEQARKNRASIEKQK
jgi:hypothetical protein